MKITQITVGLLLAMTTATPLPAQISAFTYQGRLNLNDAPADGIYDLRFTIYDALSGGGAAGGPLTNAAVDVNHGLFSVLLDFGAGVFNGEPRWLEINVRTNGGGAFTALSPRQLLTPTPYAIAAHSASNLLGALPASQISGTIPNASLPASPSFSGTVTANNFSGNGGGLTNVNAVALGGLNSSDFWRTTGNAGTTAGTHFLGTTDNQPLELRAGNIRAFRIEKDSSGFGAPNVIGGAPVNLVEGGVFGATISGGGVASIGVPRANRVGGNFGAIGGGSGNTILAQSATIGGGDGNTIETNAFSAIIGGGAQNSIAGGAGTIAGGRHNFAGLDADFAAIGGGFQNWIKNQATAGTIAGGYANTIQDGAAGCIIGGGSFNTIGADSTQATITGGYLNEGGTNSIYSAIGGGWHNTIGANSSHGTVAGGAGNGVGVNAASSAIAGGWENRTGNLSEGSALGGGKYNLTASNSICATIPGGEDNFATNYAFAVGRSAKANHTGTLVWGDSTDADITSTNDNSVTMRASGGYRLFTDSTAATGAFLEAGSGSWTSMSDRNAKENFRGSDAREVLERVVALPVQTWNYKSQDAGIRHIGPMAQDFQAAFGVGESSTGISTVDADGVALAAIQGLNQKLEETRAENVELKQRLTELESLVQKLSLAQTQR
ncbi:MAG: tail fiber domain-containing protein [Verrucomicrobia bacterium]|nr:tail fiber domain-containing protein [Verrucomicrobiota bacterium]